MSDSPYLDLYKMAAPLCEKHEPRSGGGVRGGCLVCVIVALNSALSRVDYALDEPNEMGVSAFDVDCNEERVVARAATAMQGFRRYEYVRCMSAHEFAYLFGQCLAHGLRFDDEVDRLIKERAERSAVKNRINKEAGT